MHRNDCGKTNYGNRSEAQADIERIQAKSKRKKQPVRAYICGVCGYWHLTSQPVSLVDEVKKLRAKVAEFQIEIERLKSLDHKEITLSLRKDEQIISYKKAFTKHNLLIKKLWKSNRELISRVIQLEKNKS